MFRTVFFTLLSRTDPHSVLHAPFQSVFSYFKIVANIEHLNLLVERHITDVQDQQMAMQEDRRGAGPVAHKEGRACKYEYYLAYQHDRGTAGRARKSQRGAEEWSGELMVTRMSSFRLCNFAVSEERIETA
jgi:hypothetical protein